MKRKHILRWIIAGGLWAASAACLAPPVESPKTTVIQQTPIRVPQNEQNKVDILFLVDNSPSMDAMQTELKNKFGQFFTVFQQLAASGTYADLNIGVVTSDYGAGNTANPGGGCDQSPGGQKGILQTTAAHTNPVQANDGCAGPTGSPFIHYAFNPGGSATANLPGGATDQASLVNTFTCMASVGSQGCGFEHQLESVYAALKNSKENAGFLRPDALLTVVFVTNEDDGSGPPTTDVFNPDPNKVGMYGLVDTYRQTRFGVACNYGGSLQLSPYAASIPPYGTSMTGPLTGCEAAPNNNSVMLGSEWDVQRYIDLFTLPTGRGGVKDDPLNNVILVGIDAPETPFQTRLIDYNTGQGKGKYPDQAAYQDCPAPAGMPAGTPPAIVAQQCVVRLDHSCQNHVQPGFFGDPAVRLNTVINKVQFKNITSICGDPQHQDQPPDYTQALQAVANLISSAIKPGCIPAALPNPAKPDCVVEDVTSNNDGSTTEHQLPQCTVDGSGNPLASNNFPCWVVEKKDKCAPPGPGTSPDSLGVTIYRNMIPVPPNTSARVECSTKAG